MPVKSCSVTSILDYDTRWDEKAGLQRDVLSSQVIDALEARELKRPRIRHDFLTDYQYTTLRDVLPLELVSALPADQRQRGSHHAVIAASIILARPIS
jgi:hypothetical protein